MCPLGNRPASSDHFGIDVLRSSEADGDAAFVAILCFSLAGDPVGFDNFCQGKGCHFLTTVIAAVGLLAGLLHLRGIYAVEPDLGVGDMDGVAVNDAGFAGDVGVGGGWEREDE